MFVMQYEYKGLLCKCILLVNPLRPKLIAFLWNRNIRSVNITFLSINGGLMPPDVPFVSNLTKHNNTNIGYILDITTNCN